MSCFQPREEPPPDECRPSAISVAAIADLRKNLDRCLATKPPLSRRSSVMFSILGRGKKLCDGITRRELMRVGGLAFAGLSLADILRLRAAANPEAGRSKSVIMIWLRGGASHIDSYDMKPSAPAEIRGEFRP